LRGRCSTPPTGACRRPSKPADPLTHPTAALISYRLGGRDGVSVEAAKWATVLRELGFEIVTAAGEGPVDRQVGGLAIDDVTAPSTSDVHTALDGVDLVIAENICSLPLNLPATEAVTDALRGRPAVLHHHDLPWQREQFANLPGIPADDDAWVHVVTTELSGRELRDRRGICATVVHNAFDVDAPQGDRLRARMMMEIALDERVLLQPTRALRRKNVPGGLALAEAIGATYWLTGAAEEGYDSELEDLLDGTSTRTIHGNPGLDPADIYAAADAVVLPSTWEGFGNPAIEAAIYRRPLAVGDYPIADELRAFGFRWFPASDPAPLADWLAHPDLDLVDSNREVAERHFSLDRLRTQLQKLLDDRGWLP
jgi:glycosyltransferase involved in cell wall biosynthesis